MTARSESTETPPPPVVWLALADVALVLAVFALQAAWPAPDVNEPHYLGKARHFWDPEWAAHDFFFESADTHLVFYFTCGWLTRWLSLAQFAWCGRLITWVLLAAAWQRLCRSVVRRSGRPALAAAIFLTFNVGCHLAGEWVVGGFEAKGLAYALVFAALASLVTDRWNLALVLLGGASAFHVLVGGWSATAAAVCWLLSADAPRLRQLWPGMVAGAALALAGIAPALALNWTAEPQIVAEANDIYVFRRLPHHLVPQSFRWPFLVRYVLMLLVWLGLTRAATENAALRRLRSFVTGSLAITLAGLLLALATANYPEAAAAILRYYWFRLSDVMVPVGIALHVVAGPNPDYSSAHTNPKRKRGGKDDLPRLRFGLVLGRPAVWSLICLTLLVYARDDYAAWNFFTNTPRADKSGKVLSHDDWREVCQWMADHAPPDALAITPRMAQSFTWYAERGQVVSWKDLPQDAVAVVRWWQRLVDIYGMPFPAFQGRWHDSLSERSPDRLRELGRKYRAGYLVVESEPTIELPREYANGSYAVYRLE
ncbi:MAG TPA: DUF6798 domain-containing protein [Pirellulales bacterium]|nr:DUF6798 domain-containing protein [Pirellulales bacterium]